MERKESQYEGIQHWGDTIQRTREVVPLHGFKVPHLQRQMVNLKQEIQIQIQREMGGRT
jgi:hypothetical protein